MPDFFNTDFITFKIFHLVIFAFLFFAMLIYFKIAKKYHIIDDSGKQRFFSVKVRLIIQFVVVGLIFFYLDVYYIFPWWVLLISSIVCVGIINAYNIMDGIKGMTGLNSLAILGSLQYVNQRMIQFVHPDFIIYAILACIVFLLVGGVGNTGIAIWIVVLLLKLIIETEDIIWILFLAIYGVDVICTIGHRVYLKQHIFKPHRLHFYQVWVEKAKCPQLWVSVVYATIQLIICIVVIYFWKRIPEIMLSLTLLGLLVALYVLKFQYDLEDVSKIS